MCCGKQLRNFVLNFSSKSFAVGTDNINQPGAFLEAEPAGWSRSECGALILASTPVYSSLSSCLNQYVMRSDHSTLSDGLYATTEMLIRENRSNHSAYRRIRLFPHLPKCLVLLYKGRCLSLARWRREGTLRATIKTQR